MSSLRRVYGTDGPDPGTVRAPILASPCGPAPEVFSTQRSQLLDGVAESDSAGCTEVMITTLSRFRNAEPRLSTQRIQFIGVA